MKTTLLFLKLALLSLTVAGTSAVAQTDGTAKMEVTLLDYVGASNDDHYTVVWVTTADNTFVKSLRKQGPTSWTSSEWANHCRTWNTARNGSTALDGYTSATARDYAGTNSPVVLTWNGRDASNALMPDGDYKFWVQYAENSGQGPYTTSGLLWTKGAAGATNTYQNQGVNFANMKVTWVPAGVPSVAPTITSIQLTGGNLTIGGSGPANSTYHVLVSADPSLAIGQWTSVATNSTDSTGAFTVSAPIEAGVTSRFLIIRLAP